MEKDPTGKQAGEPGAKLDAGKNRLGLMIGGFPRALEAVGQVTTFGANITARQSVGRNETGHFRPGGTSTRCNFREPNLSMS